MRRVLLIAAAAIALVGAAITFVAGRAAEDRARSQRQADRVVAAYLRDWQAGRWADAAALTHPTDGLDPARYLARTAADLHLVSLRLSVSDVITRKGPAHADFRVRMQVGGLGSFSYTGSTTLVRTPRIGWQISFAESSVHPLLGPGQRLIRVRELGRRGQILTPDGRALAPLDAELAANVVGQVAPMTSGQAKAKGIQAEEGDLVGTSGLEAAFDSTLAPIASGAVAIGDPSGNVVTTLARFAGKDGADVKTTLDIGTQIAAETALAGLKKPAALVAIDTVTGAVKAIVSEPLTGFPRAFAGSYPPGSTFKIVTATAGLMAGRDPQTILDCPKSIKVGGRTFVNAEKEELGRISFLDAFAQSCNTWFAGLVEGLPLTAVADAAALYGFSAHPDPVGPLALGGMGGYFPTPLSYAQAAGQAIGQDRVAVSPVQMASVVAAVAAGQWRQPYLTIPAPANLAHHDIPVAATLRQFMAAVVSWGTAAKAGLPAGTYGKTGTAEFGPGPPYKTHAWFVGYRATTAFAIVVQDGGFGGEVAAPVAARFLRLLGP